MCTVQYTQNRPDIKALLARRECLYDKLTLTLFEDLSLNEQWPDIVKLRKDEEDLVKRYMNKSMDSSLPDFFKVRRSIMWNWLLKNPECQASPDDLFEKEVV